MTLKIDRNDIVSIDFETYYAVGYSLTDKDMNMSEYVRHENFKIHCVAIKEGDEPVRIYTGDAIEKKIKSIDWKHKYVLAHNTAFDGFILSEIFDVIPRGYLDTLSMSRGLYGPNVSHKLDDLANRLGIGGKIKEVLKQTKGVRDLPLDLLEKLSEYCAVDTQLCYDAFWKMYPAFPDVELRLVDLTIRMFCDPKLLVDTDITQSEIKREISSKLKLLNDVNEERQKRGLDMADEGALLSNEKFAQLLIDYGVAPPTKISKRTNKVAYAFAKTDPAFQLLSGDERPHVKTLIQARLAHKTTISETRAARFQKAGERGMRMPVLLNYYGAHTGRWSGGNKLNLQNLKRGGNLRKALLAPPGMVVVVADSAQIEARLTAWLADEIHLVTAFKEKKDVYVEMASSIYGKSPEEISPIERFVGKTCILGLGYGMGAAKLQATLALGVNGPKVELSLAACNHIVNVYRTKNAKIAALWRVMQSVLHDMLRMGSGEYKILEYSGTPYMGSIRLPNQMKLLYPGLMDQEGEITYNTRYGFTKIYGGLLTENVIQALARIIIAEQMLEIASRYSVVTMTHDEIVWLAPEKEAQESFDWGTKIMRTPPTWAPDLPLSSAGGFDYCYSK